MFLAKLASRTCSDVVCLARFRFFVIANSLKPAPSLDRRYSMQQHPQKLVSLQSFERTAAEQPLRCDIAILDLGCKHGIDPCCFGLFDRFTQLAPRAHHIVE